MNPLSELYINRNFQKSISTSIYHHRRGFSMNSLFIAYKNKEWFHFVVRIGPPALFLFYCLCVVSFFFSLFSFLFIFFVCVESTTCWGSAKSLSILLISSGVVPRFISGVLRGGFFQPYLVINLTGLIKFGKIRFTSYLHLPLRITCFKVFFRSWYTNFSISLMVICSLDALKSSLEKR